MAENRQTSLHDVLNYEPDTYLTPDEMELIQSTFRDKRMMKLLRKVLLPSVGDPELPIEELGSDTWLLGRDWSQIPDENVKALAVARQEAIKFVMGGLIKLKVLANQKKEDPMEEALRRSKDSTK